MATCATVESPEVMVTDELIPVQEFDRVKNAVCLLRPSTSDPRYIHLNISANLILAIHINNESR
jgi:hypothetical protein